MGEGRVQRDRHSAMGLAQGADPAAEGVGDGDGEPVIVRSVIDDEDLRLRVPLAERALDRLAEIIRTVTNGNRNGDAAISQN